MSELNGKQALRKLLEGNRRFMTAHAIHPNQTVERRRELLSGQSPFAVVVGCADSRIPPEILFDQGLGDLFVIRVAGNIVDDIVLGSIEYAVEHLGVPLVLVLGHEGCGAVTAAVHGGRPEGHIHSIIDAIFPVVARARYQDGNLLDNAIKLNVASVVDQITTAYPILAKAVSTGVLDVVGAYYHLTTGKVDCL